MRRSRRLTPVGDVLARLLDGPLGDGQAATSKPSASAARVTRVFSAFERIGPPVTQHADPVDFRRGVLTLRVHESAWLTELSFLRGEIMERVNRMVPNAPVRDVRLRLGPRRKETAAVPAPRPLTEQERDAVERWVAPIADDAVREAVRRAAGRSVARGAVPIAAASGPAGPRIARPDPEPTPTLSYGYGAGTGQQRAGWTTDRWQKKRSSDGRE